MSDKADFIHANKDENYLQIDTMIFERMVKHSQSFQNSKFAMSLQYLEKEVRDEVDAEVDEVFACKISYKLF